MSFLSAFNAHFKEFMEDIMIIFPNDKTIKTTYNTVNLLIKANPRQAIKTWNKFITLKYKKEISKGDFSFITEKDYTEDIMQTQNTDKTYILEHIEIIREKVRAMDENNKEKAMKYIQNLCKLGELYINETR